MKRRTSILILCAMLFISSACGKSGFSQNTKAIAQASASVLTLEVYDEDEVLMATGSGFVAFEPNLVVTNFHVIEGAHYITAVDENMECSEVMEVVVHSTELDIAVLRLEMKKEYSVLPLGGEELEKGETVVAIGSPLGVNNTVSSGMLSGLIEMDRLEYIQFTAPISQGSSGGALFNNSGEVIGITSGSFVDGQNMNLAIPISVAIELYEDHLAQKDEESLKAASLYNEYGRYSVTEIIEDYQSLIGKNVGIEGWVSANHTKFIESLGSKDQVFRCKETLYLVEDWQDVWSVGVQRQEKINSKFAPEEEGRAKNLGSITAQIDKRIYRWDEDISGIPAGTPVCVFGQLDFVDEKIVLAVETILRLD